ncbi:CHAT domain-containing protein [Laspinema olomoucense]|uniref:CHAT domain-containing protein n=1 Tax=Laspinema olomoucense TaxID=3231600 RepID=UPI0021BB6222|nr:CHAT domain-containing tetratricopeptide repeat protein [Laspinema sp. D3c]MCT7992455.1 CHAT domain-containing protein [Laspinema sp. D3c]
MAQTFEEQQQEAKQLLDLGLGQYEQRQFLEALQSWEQALKIYQRIGDKTGEGNTSLYLGNLYIHLGEYIQAEQYFLESLEISRQIGDKSREGYVLMGLADVYLNLKEYAQAEQYFLQSLEISRQVDNKIRQGINLNKLGEIYYTLGEFVQAEEYYQEFLMIARDLNDKEQEINALNSLGLIFRDLGKYAEAKQYFLESLAIAQETNNRALEGNILHNIGLVHQSQGQYNQATAYYEESLIIFGQIDSQEGEATILNNLGILYGYLENYVLAEEFYKQSLEIFQEIGHESGQSNILNNLGLLYQAQKRYNEAEKFFFKAIELYEKLRPGLNDLQKISLFEQQTKTYEFLQQVLINQNKIETALEVSERGRVRAFVELLGKRLANHESNISNYAPLNLAEIKQIAATKNATIVQYSYIRQEFPVDDVQRLNESDIYIWVIKPTGEITFRQSDLKHLWQTENTSVSKIIAEARCFDNYLCRRHLTIAQTRNGATEVTSDGHVEFNREAAQQQAIRIPQPQQREWQQLHQLLIEPIADLLPTDPKERVIFVPHASLFLVPFPALPDANGTYLIEKHTVLTAPSIQVLDLTRQQKLSQTKRDGHLLIVGNPTMPSMGEPPQKLSPLPGAEKEAQDIAQLLNVTPLIGSQATKSAVVEKMPSSRIIHLATHGSFDPNRGIGSWLALTPTDSDNGFLTAEEIFELELNAELVVLSACDTGRGRITGDGVIGLSRSFISAGVPSVLVSLWKVDDAATAYLMREFYENWLDGSDKAIALRQAMLNTMQQYPAPENWAAFTLIGEAE